MDNISEPCSTVVLFTNLPLISKIGDEGQGQNNGLCFSRLQSSLGAFLVFFPFSLRSVGIFISSHADGRARLRLKRSLAILER